MVNDRCGLVLTTDALPVIGEIPTQEEILVDRLVVVDGRHARVFGNEARDRALPAQHAGEHFVRRFVRSPLDEILGSLGRQTACELG